MNRILGTVAIAITLVAAPAYATNGIRMIGFGPVQNSMGGASVGVGLDAATILSNPANIIDLGQRVDFGATYFGADVRQSAKSVPGFGIVNDTAEQKSDRGASPVPAFGLIIPYSDALTFGIGAYGVAGLGTDYRFNVLSNTVYTNYSQMRFAPGVAYKVNEMVSVGATVNAMYNTLGYSLGSTAFGQVPHNDTSTFSYGATLGVRVTPMKGLAVGVAYETKSFGPRFKYSTPAFSFDPDGPNTAFGNVPVAANREELTFESPQVATLGASYRPVPMVLLALDLQWINWAGVLGNDKPKYNVLNAFPDGTPITMPFDVEWKDQYVVKVGAEVEALPLLKVRVGYNYGSKILNDEKVFQNIAFPAIAQHHITAGLGYSPTKKVAVNVGAMYSPKATLSGSTTLQNGAPASYETSMSQLSFDAGVAYAF